MPWCRRQSPDFATRRPPRDFCNGLLTALDLGIRGFKPKTETLEVTRMEDALRDFAQPTKAYSFEDGVRKVAELMFEQGGRGGYTSGYRLGYTTAFVPTFAPSILQMTPKERTSENGLSLDKDFFHDEDY